jgi:OOP family OmpA-OmpF porin
MKNKAVLAFLGFVAALALALPAMAQKSTGAFYAGLGFGQSNSDNFCDNLGPPCKDQDQTWRVMGGYEFNRYIAVEGALSNLGAHHDLDPTNTKDQKVQALEAILIGSYPVFGDFAIYGKLGAYQSRVRGSISTSLNASQALGSFNEKSTDVTYGFGLQWNLFPQFALRADVQRYPKVGGSDPNTAAGAKQDIVVWTIGGIVRFR